MADGATDKKTVIVGLGKTGLSCARYLVRRGEPFVVVDSRANPPGFKELLTIAPNVDCYVGGLEPFVFEQAEKIIVSPGVSVKESVIAGARQRGASIVGDVALFAQQADAPIVAITGSNGKSTVTTMLDAMAQQANLNVKVGGNLGVPALDLLADSTESQEQHPEFYVLELSSFQLETTPDLHAHAAVVLNISADHMDRYTSLQEYVAAKQNIYHNCQHKVFNRDDPAVAAMIAAQDAQANGIVSFGLSAPPTEQDYGLEYDNGQAWLVKGRQRLMAAKDVYLPGRHNQANALAALALGETMNIPVDAMLSVLRRFTGLPHRMQWVATKHNVAWYNDSKGTNVGATVSAIAGMPGNKVLIAGGDGKGADFDPLREAVIANNVRLVILIGKDADRIASVLTGVVQIEKAGDMTAAVAVANKLARPNEKVILSPACASFDMFSDYQQRGEVFMAAVNNLPE
ncbi:MAG: UDP-N-acetylmuramoyl-L-alanine--D-glutamate ligase [Gammaproteobacteria bacterium]